MFPQDPTLVSQIYESSREQYETYASLKHGRVIIYTRYAHRATNLALNVSVAFNWMAVIEKYDLSH
jgi:hypothetical protein